MDPEIKDKTNNCEAEETTLDSSPLNNNNVLKEGVKKMVSTNSLDADDSAMDVDTEDNNSSSDKLSEKKNGVLEENNKLEENSENKKSEVSQKTDDNVSDEKSSSNHEQNNVDEKDTSSDAPSSKESVNVEQTEQNQTEKCDEELQTVDKNDQTELSSSEHLDNKNETDSNGLPPESETPMEVEDTPSKDSPKTESSPADTSEKDSVNDKVRPEKASASPKTPAEKEQEKDVSEKPADADSSKPDSPEKATKDSKKEKSEVTPPPEATTSEAVDSKNKENKSKEANDKPSSETKSESSKKDGESSGKKKKSKTCEECGVKKGLKFQVLFKGKTRFLCSDTCMKNFKTKQMQAKASAATPPAPTPEKPSIEKCVQCQKELSSDKGFFPVVGEAKPLCSEDCMKKYHADNFPIKSCSQCKKVLDSPQNPDILTWETMVFCNEDCLGKYQSFLGSHCTCCHAPVPQASLGKYSVCFGADIRQFCSCGCLDDFKKNLKVCSFCQTDLSAGIDSFLAPVGDKGQFKDFCSQNCMERYEVMNNITKNAPQAQVCSHCKKQGTFKIQVKHDNQSYSLCSDLCVAGFRCSHNIKDKMCDTCFNFFSIAAEKAKDFSFKFDSLFKQFCTKACMTLFVLSHRKIVACVSCKVKKYNFDMIEKTDNNNQTQIFCSLNCLSLYRVSVNATSSKSVRCDNCSKNLPAQYHLTMSDGSVRNFCNYNCVMLFQNQYTNVCTLTSTTTRQTSAPTPTTKPAGVTASPVISSVISLAPPPPRNAGSTTLIRNIVPPKLVPATRQPMQPLAIIGSKIYSLQPAPRAVTPVLTQNLVQPKLDSDQQPLSALTAINDSKPASSTITSPSTVTNASGQQVIREVIVKPPAPKSQKNKSVACKPIMQHKGINVKPLPCHKAVQTEDRPRPVLLPIPVPFYVPVPVHMFSRPVPCPVPFPVPMFVPLVAPSKDSSTQESMASGENSSFTSDKGSEDYKNRNDANNETNQRKDSQSDGKSDRDNYTMKTDDPLSSTSDECNDNEEDEDEYVFKDGKSHHHGKRHAHHKSKGRKKSKMENLNNESHNSLTTQDRSLTMPSDQLESAPRLKHTFGVNAWKQWVLQKNDQMVRGSQSSRKFKLFKTDLLQLPPDELNYSLSLFVKEVRKPNGEEYGSGSIYYLCLGIQKYLFQNGRIDNIFSDPYYEKFTECLHDILLSQDALSSMEGFPSSRIEEETLWESKQLGAHSPYALLNTVMYFNTKYFKLKSVDDHLQLSFNHMYVIYERKTPEKLEKSAFLRYYPNGRKCELKDCRHSTIFCLGRRCMVKECKHKDTACQGSDCELDSEECEKNICLGIRCEAPDCKHAVPICIDAPRKDPSENSFQQIEHASDSLRCPVRLYEFYLSKCPESCRSRNDMFYLHPERSCVPDSPVWYSGVPLGHDVLSKMMQRIKIVREIYES